MAKEKKKKPAEKLVTRQRVQAALMLALGLLILNQTIQFYRMKDEIAFLDSLQESNSEVIQDINKSKEYLSSFGEDLNGIRQFLLLPTKNYDFGEGDQAVMLSEEEEEDLTTQLFTYVEKLGTYEKNQERYEANLATVQTSLKEAYWKEKGLSVDSGSATSEAMVYSFKDPALNNVELFSLSVGYDGLLSVESLDEKWEIEDEESAENSLKELKALVDGNVDELRAQVTTLETARASAASMVSSAAVTEVLASKGMSVSTELSSPDEFHYEFKNSDSETLAKLSISKEDGEMTLKAEETVKIDGEAQLVSALEQVDARSEREKLVEQREDEMESVFADRAFKAVLQEMGLQMGVKAETDSRISYPLLREDGQTLRVIYIDKTTGEVKVENPDGQESHTLSMAIELIDPTGKKKLSTPLWS